MTHAYGNANWLIQVQQRTTTIGDLIYAFDVMGNRIKVGGTLAYADWPTALAAVSPEAISSKPRSMVG